MTPAAPGWRQDDTDPAAWIAVADDAAQMRRLGAGLGRLLQAGDLVLLDGPLGAGKTTLAQGIGEALEVRGAVTSPTFVIARRHPGPRVALVHVDAYRVGSGAELDDLDLDADVAASVTVVEWGVGKAEELAEDRLEVRIDRPAVDPDAVDDDPAAGPRQVTLRGRGARWAGLRPSAQ